MPIVPIQAASQVLLAGSAAKAAASVASNVAGSFANLLQNTLSNQSQAADNEQAAPQNQASKAGVSQPEKIDLSGIAQLINVPELKAQTAAETESFAAQFLALLAEAGIDVTGGIQLQVDELGTIRVLGNRADKSQIETLLASHPELADQFREIEAKSNLLQAIHEATQTQQELALDSQPAVAQSPNLFSNNGVPRFTLHVYPDRTESTFPA